MSLFMRKLFENAIGSHSTKCYGRMHDFVGARPACDLIKHEFHRI
jgi:hypothetical protein